MDFHIKLMLTCTSLGAFFTFLIYGVVQLYNDMPPQSILRIVGCMVFIAVGCWLVGLVTAIAFMWRFL